MTLSKVLEYLLLFCLPALLSFLFMPQMYGIAKNLGAVDDPSKSERKIHKKTTPLLGGVVIFLSFLIVYTLFQVVQNPEFTWISKILTDVDLFQRKYYMPEMEAILIGSFLVVLTGIFDDISPIRARIKFVIQILAACVVVYYPGGLIVNDFLGIEFPVQIARIFTVLWIVTITNAINLTDGLDGLAGGLSFISLMTMAIIGMFDATIYSQFVVVITLIMAGAIFGFLPYNLPPARIFMGDSGALFIGFMIGCLSVLGFKQAAFTSFLIPVVILAIPIFDTVFAFFRRTIKRIPAGTADAEHFHHKVLQTTKSQKVSLFWIYGLSALFSLSAIIYSFSKLGGTIVFFVMFIIAEIFVEYFGIVSMRYRPFLALFDKLFPNPVRKQKHLQQIKDSIRSQPKYKNVKDHEEIVEEIKEPRIGKITGVNLDEFESENTTENK